MRRESLLKLLQVGAGKIDGGGTGRRGTEVMAWDNALGFVRGHFIQGGQPLLAAGFGLRVCRPEVNAGRNARTAENGFGRRDPHVGGIAVCLLDIEFLTVHHKGG